MTVNESRGGPISAIVDALLDQGGTPSADPFEEFCRECGIDLRFAHVYRVYGCLGVTLFAAMIGTGLDAQRVLDRYLAAIGDPPPDDADDMVTFLNDLALRPRLASVQ